MYIRLLLRTGIIINLFHRSIYFDIQSTLIFNFSKKKKKFILTGWMHDRQFYTYR